MAEEETAGLKDDADLDATATDGTSPVTPFPTHDGVPMVGGASGLFAQAEPSTPDAAPSEQGSTQEAVSPQDVGAALIAEDRKLGGKMGLAIVPTSMGPEPNDVSTTILIPNPGIFMSAKQIFYGINSELGLVSYVDPDAKDGDAWSMTKYRLRNGHLSSSQLQPVKTPEEMERWTNSLNVTREYAERSAAREAAREATQSEFERSLPQKAMEAIQTPLVSISATPAAPTA